MTALNPAADTAPDAQTFRLRTQLLKEGRTHTILASTQNDRSAMNIAIKSYANGGENEFHAHGREDHTVIILQEPARFEQPDKAPVTIGRNEGILLPAGATTGSRRSTTSRSSSCGSAMSISRSAAA